MSHFPSYWDHPGQSLFPSVWEPLRVQNKVLFFYLNSSHMYVLFSMEPQNPQSLWACDTCVLIQESLKSEILPSSAGVQQPCYKVVATTCSSNSLLTFQNSNNCNGDFQHDPVRLCVPGSESYISSGGLEDIANLILFLTKDEVLFVYQWKMSCSVCYYEVSL